MFSGPGCLTEMGLHSSLLVLAAIAGCSGIPSWTHPKYVFEGDAMSSYRVPQLGLRLSLPDSARIQNGVCEMQVGSLAAACGCPVDSFIDGVIMLRGPTTELRVNLQCARFTPTLWVSLSGDETEENWGYVETGARNSIRYSVVLDRQPNGTNVQVRGMVALADGRVLHVESSYAASWFLGVVGSVDVDSP